MTFLYNLAFILFGLSYLPIFLVKIRQAENGRQLLAERLGFFPRSWREKFLGKKTIWLHAVSVGEVMAVQKFLEGFLTICPEYHIVLTTVTPTGQKIAKQMEGEQVSVCYFPFDLTIAVRCFFKILGPECLLLAETEIWPNLLMEAKRRRVPVGILNGRLSARSAKRYKKFRFLFASLWDQLDFILTQTEEDAARFASVGIESSRIHVLGNMKFDNVPSVSKEADPRYLRQAWGFDVEDWIVVAGSTHPGEEEALANVVAQLSERYPFLKMLVAPRHIERCAPLLDTFKKKGLRVHLATETSLSDQAPQVVLLNRLGVLKHLYGMANAVFMGGSWAPRGGQNPIEPAHFKKAILHGPHIFNFEKIYQLLDQEGGALLVRDETQMIFALKRLMENTGEGHLIGLNAFEVVRNLQGATQRHLDWVSKFLISKLSAKHESLERTSHAEVHAKLFSSSR